MIIVKPSVQVEFVTPGALNLIERAGRTCYQSDPKGNTNKFVKMLLDKGHHSVLEHAHATIRFICDRGVTHEIVRHRLASYSQESTRYCNYTDDKFGEEIRVIEPPDLNKDTELFRIWCLSVETAERAYLDLVYRQVPPQIARSVLPNCLKTELVMTANFREWRHFFGLRCAPAAHPQMRQVANMGLTLLAVMVPVVFDDLVPQEDPGRNRVD